MYYDGLLPRRILRALADRLSPARAECIECLSVPADMLARLAVSRRLWRDGSRGRMPTVLCFQVPLALDRGALLITD